MAMRSSPKDPLIVVIGATGTGKSKLAVSLATKYNGEIINADAIQMYRGLPIVTNKIPESERNGVPHHLLDFVDLHEKPWTVHHFVKESAKIIAEIRSRGKLPIVVGGTHYYTHALLFKGATLTEESRDEEVEDQESPKGGSEDDHKGWPILDASTEEIYAKLKEVDPAIASRWHPNDRRKLQRSLEIWLQTGRKASEVYDRQKKTADPVSSDQFSETQEEMRYSSLIFWLEAEDSALKERLNRRVDVMVENGLLEEVRAMNSFELEMRYKDVSLDRSKGVWVAIGYKEMEPWLEAQDVVKTDDSCLFEIKEACIESVKAATRRYAKSQNRYIRIRLANALAAAGGRDTFFLLDCTNLENWAQSITRPAETVAEAFLNGYELPSPTSLSTLARQLLTNMKSNEGEARTRQAHFCTICEKTLMSEKEWVTHLKSGGHKKISDSARKRAHITAMKELHRKETRSD